MACSRRHDITLEDEWNRKREHMHFSSAFTQRRHSLRLIRQTAAPQQITGRGTVKCAPPLHFPFTFLHSANLCWITGGVFNSVFVVLSRSPVQSCDARNCDFVLRDHFAWIAAFIFQYLNILAAIILKYVYMRKCKINCYLIYMTVFRLYR